jgi:hypothetical protein
MTRLSHCEIVFPFDLHHASSDSGSGFNDLMISGRVELTCLPRVEHTAHALNPSMHYTTPGTFLVSD